LPTRRSSDRDAPRASQPDTAARVARREPDWTSPGSTQPATHHGNPITQPLPALPAPSAARRERRGYARRLRPHRIPATAERTAGRGCPAPDENRRTRHSPVAARLEAAGRNAPATVAQADARPPRYRRWRQAAGRTAAAPHQRPAAWPGARQARLRQ